VQRLVSTDPELPCGTEISTTRVKGRNGNSELRHVRIES